MPAALHHRLRQARRGLGYLAATVLIAMALAAGIVSQLLPLAERHPDRIAAWLSARARQQVSFDRVQTRWTRRGPLLQLDNLRIGRGADAVMVGDAEILVSQYAGLLPGRSFTELRLRALDLTVERGVGGQWQVRGLPGQTRAAHRDPLSMLQRLGELQVIGARLRVLAPDLGMDVRLPQVDLRVRVSGQRVQAGLRARMRADGQPVDAVFDFERDSGDGRAWLGMERADLAQWSPLLHVAGVDVQGGTGGVQAWAALRAHRIALVTTELALRNVALASGTAPPAGTERARVRLARLQGLVRWRAIAGGWRADTQALRLADGAQAPRVEKLTLAGGRRIALMADRIDAGPLLAVAALSDRLQPGLQRWLQAAAPEATLQDVGIAGIRDGALHVRARIAGFGFRPVGAVPGLRGLRADVEGDASGMVLRFAPAAPVTVDWPRGFGVVHRIRLDGSVAGWREGAGWRTETSALRVAGGDFSVTVRGGLWFQGDGTRPRMDLAASVGPAPITAAKGFWTRQSMAPAALHWLDTALVAGRITGGSAIVSGDLDDWPFRASEGAPANGIFHASARIADATIRFLPDWPAADHFNADVEFVADGFSARGNAALAGVAIPQFDGGIAHFGKSVLTVNAQGKGDAGQLLALLRRSPLHKRYGDTLDNLQASGPTLATYVLEQPLYPGAPAANMGGRIRLQDARLAEKRWDLAFDDVSGEATYGLGGFNADRLDVRRDRRPGKLSLRSGDSVRDPRQAFEAELLADLGAGELLERAPGLGWLKSKVSGSSPWTIAVAIPKASANQQAAPSRLLLRSTLVGTTLALPAPLDKPAGAALPTAVELALPLGQGEVAVTFANRFALRARSANGRTGVRVVLGSDRVSAAPPPSGLVATGRTDRMDAIEWAALTASGSGDAGGQGGGLSLRSVDVTADRLQMIGSNFPNTRLRAAPAAGGTAIRLDGDALAGALLLPRADGAAVAGRLQRLYWRSAKPATPAATGSRPAAPRDDIEPARIPPLNLAVDDLRFGDASLGSASFRTQPTASGMRVVQLQTRSPRQSIDASGDWYRSTTGIRTRLDLRLQSEDVGALLGSFGFGKQVAEGKGSLRLQAQWPGSPAAFRPATLDGNLQLALRDGRLVEIEPGAGRVLGLVGIAQLPRRLSFDFGDLFDKGFAFDSIKGDVRLAAASARSDNLVIDGPAAEIRIHGAANLGAQTFDQTIDVFPKTGNLLTVAGAIAGGPVGAAIGAAANAVLKKPLGQLAAKTYRVTGPWKDPKVETIGRSQSAAAAAAPPG